LIDCLIVASRIPLGIQQFQAVIGFHQPVDLEFKRMDFEFQPDFM